MVKVHEVPAESAAQLRRQRRHRLLVDGSIDVSESLVRSTSTMASWSVGPTTVGSMARARGWCRRWRRPRPAAACRHGDRRPGSGSELLLLEQATATSMAKTMGTATIRRIAAGRRARCTPRPPDYLFINSASEIDVKPKMTASHERDAVEVLLDHGRPGRRRPEPATEHVRQAAALAAVQQDQDDQRAADDDVDRRARR